MFETGDVGGNEIMIKNKRIVHTLPMNRASDRGKGVFRVYIDL